ncbi:MAG: hypothetical protein Kow0092_28780 [Deferrisomatales bacterium]
MAQRQAQVIDLARFIETSEPKPRPFGSVRRRKLSTKLYVRFTYLGRIVDEATGLEASPENERKLRAFLERVGQAIQAGTFRFAEVFPGATDAKKAFFCRLEGRTYQPGPGEVTFGDYLDPGGRRRCSRGTRARRNAGTTGRSSETPCVRIVVARRGSGLAVRLPLR